MKTTITICLISIFGFVLTSFNYRNTSISLEQALLEKKIEIEIIPAGTYSGKSIKLRIKNIANSKLNLKIASGTIFVPDDEGEQTLIAPEEELFAMKKNETRSLNVSAYCTEASDRCPSVNSKFKIATTQNPSLKNLVVFLDSLKNLDDHIIQQSIWCVTDSESVSNVYNEDPAVSKKLRNYLCSLTGQKDTWYNTRRETSVGSDRHIVRIAKEIKGQIAFQATEPVELQGTVQDSTGKVIYTNPNKTSLLAGKIKFDFKLKVEGWDPGNYAVVYTNNGKEIIRQSFSF